MFVADGGFLQPNTKWSATLSALNSSGTEVGLNRYEFSIDALGISAGRATPPIDPALVVGILLILVAVVLVVLLLARVSLPRVDATTGRIASIAGAVLSGVLGIVILFAGKL